jgi:hypothetical protein
MRIWVCRGIVGEQGHMHMISIVYVLIELFILQGKNGDEFHMKCTRGNPTHLDLLVLTLQYGESVWGCPPRMWVCVENGTSTYKYVWIVQY